jgi:lipopolysaccharide heptosyltransferase I
MGDAHSGPGDSTIDVLVVKPSSLGDIIHAAGAVAGLAQACPSCRIAWVVNEGYASFVREFPGVDRVVAFPRERFRMHRLPRAVSDAVAWCRGLEPTFDVAIDLQGLQRSGLITRCSKAPERFGPRTARELGWLHYNRRIDLAPAGPHVVDQHFHMVEQVLARSRHFESSGPLARPEKALVVPEANRQAFKARYPDFDCDVALFPGTRWESKLWTETSWSGLADELAGDGTLRVAFLGAPFEQNLIERIVANVRTTRGVTSLVGELDLWDTALALSRVRCAVTMDSAPLHLAAALGTPTVSLFGPSRPERVAPRGAQHQVLRHDSLDCLGCNKKRCPLAVRRCLPEMEVERVALAVRELLG